MTLFNLQQALQHAEAGGYAIGSFNFYNPEMFIGILDAAVQERSPVILATAEAHLPYMRWRSFMQMIKAEAEAAPIPVVIHLDHAIDYKSIYQAIHLGYTSVMYDGSVLGLDENIANTRHIVEIAHTLGVSVEAELGHIGGTTEEVGGRIDGHARFTDPNLTTNFVAQTSVDALAVSFGTMHGFHVEEPCLDYDLLAEINRRIETPLVLHGGTGLSDEVFRQVIELGIRKINYGTDTIATAAQAACRVANAEPDLINYAPISEEVQRSVRELIAGKMRLFGSSGKTWV